MYAVSQVRMMNYGQIVDEMSEIGSDEEKAKMFIDAYKKMVKEDAPGFTEAQVMQRTSGNLGYLMGYAPTKIDTGMWEKLCISHPVFGEALKNMCPTEKTG